MTDPAYEIRAATALTGLHFQIAVQRAIWDIMGCCIKAVLAAHTASERDIAAMAASQAAFDRESRIACARMETVKTRQVSA